MIVSKLYLKTPELLLLAPIIEGSDKNYNNLNIVSYYNCMSCLGALSTIYSSMPSIAAAHIIWITSINNSEKYLKWHSLKPIQYKSCFFSYKIKSKGAGKNKSYHSNLSHQWIMPWKSSKQFYPLHVFSLTATGQLGGSQLGMPCGSITTIAFMVIGRQLLCLKISF